MLPCDSMTPLARPIEPEVKTMTATASGSTAGTHSAPSGSGSPAISSAIDSTRPSRAGRSMSMR